MFDIPVGSILVLEDEPVCAQALVRCVLQPRVALVVGDAPSARRALERAPRFAGLILDWQLAEGTCEPVLRRARELYPSPLTPILINTSFGHERAISDAAALFGATVVPKLTRDTFAPFTERFDQNAARVRVIDRQLRELRGGPRALPFRMRQVLEARLDGVVGRHLPETIGTKIANRLLKDALAELGVPSIDALRASLDKRRRTA